MANLSSAYAIARTCLNDDGASLWTDANLLQKAIYVNKKLVRKLAMNGLPMLREEFAQRTVTAGTLFLPELPNDIIDPVRMVEKAVGETNVNYIPMELKDDVPNMDQETNLRFFVWRNNKIEFLGATSDRVVKLYYTKSLSDLVDSDSPLPCILAENYLGPGIAALAYASLQNFTAAETWQSEANEELDKLIRDLVKGQQKLPVRKRPFSARLRFGRRITAY